MWKQKHEFPGECHLRKFPSLERIQRHPSLSGHWQHIPVVANGPEEATTSALLAGDRLFVASTSSNEESPYRETFPAVATRLLSDGLQPVHAGSLDGEVQKILAKIEHLIIGIPSK